LPTAGVEERGDDVATSGEEIAVRIIRSADLPFVPAGHEDPQDPGVWKRVLLQKADFRAGHVQMVNWARLPPGNRFAAHYHEDMQEVFVIVRGTAELTAGGETVTLGRGDAVLIDHHEVHQMSNPGPEEVEYLAIGVSRGAGGKTVNVDPA
jgi:mannose-6-phosphate isomerase-like protein (cupin superfamily)